MDDEGDDELEQLQAEVLERVEGATYLAARNAARTMLSELEPADARLFLDETLRRLARRRDAGVGLRLSVLSSVNDINGWRRSRKLIATRREAPLTPASSEQSPAPSAPSGHDRDRLLTPAIREWCAARGIDPSAYGFEGTGGER